MPQRAVACTAADDARACAEVVEGNPCLDYMKHIVFPSERFPAGVQLKRTPENGGDKVYNSYEEVEADFVSGALHPVDLKNMLAASINFLLEPVRQVTSRSAADAGAKVLIAFFVCGCSISVRASRRSCWRRFAASR